MSKIRYSIHYKEELVADENDKGEIHLIEPFNPKRHPVFYRYVDYLTKRDLISWAEEKLNKGLTIEQVNYLKSIGVFEGFMTPVDYIKYLDARSVTDDFTIRRRVLS